MNPDTSSPSLRFLDGLRAFAALWVLAHHVYIHPPHAETDRAFYGWSGPLKSLRVLEGGSGHFAVVIFIVLSGFCLMISPARSGKVPQAGPFLVRRARRILPPYYAALLVSLVFIAAFIGSKNGSEWDIALPVTWQSLGSRLLLINPIGMNGGAINGVFWSIAVEWHLYFLFLPLLLAATRFGWKKVVTGVTLLSFAGAGVLLRAVGTDASFTFLALFVWGMTGAHIVFSSGATGMRSPQFWFALSAASGAGFALLFVLPRIVGLKSPFFLLDFWAGGAFVTFLVGLCHSPGVWPRRILEAPFLVWIGSISYSLYLLHEPIIALLWRMGIWRLTDRRLGFGALYCCSLFVSLVVAYGFYSLVERPFVTRSRRV